MPQSLSEVIIHIVFSTKNREKLITKELQNELFSYLVTILKDMDCFVYKVGGVEDHVHIACKLPRSLSQADLVSKLKTTSSKWIKTKGPKSFAWQQGYSVFSISASHLDALTCYIENQEEHHHKTDFKTELLGILKKYNLSYDEKYLWE